MKTLISELWFAVFASMKLARNLSPCTTLIKSNDTNKIIEKSSLMPERGNNNNEILHQI